MGEAVENKSFWKKQRSWAMILGVVGTVIGFIPAVQVASAPMLAVAGLLGYKGIADAQTRIENTAAKTGRVTEDTVAKLMEPPC